MVVYFGRPRPRTVGIRLPIGKYSPLIDHRKRKAQLPSDVPDPDEWRYDHIISRTLFTRLISGENVNKRPIVPNAIHWVGA